jgi:hypothetical protein
VADNPSMQRLERQAVWKISLGEQLAVNWYADGVASRGNISEQPGVDALRKPGVHAPVREPGNHAYSNRDLTMANQVMPKLLYNVWKLIAITKIATVTIFKFRQSQSDIPLFFLHKALGSVT